MGRVGISVHGTPLVFPVNYVLDGEAIVFRTGAGSKLAAAERGPVCFEVDGVDREHHSGWSVLVGGRLEEVTEVLDPLQMLPAPGQGALAVECRDGDPLAAELAVLDDPHTRAAVTAERAVLATLEGGCAAPIGTSANRR